MDNAELLLLLESHDSLAAKVEEAVQVLELYRTRSKASKGEIQELAGGESVSGCLAARQPSWLSVRVCAN